MTDCPIGLICSDFECDRTFCNFLAQPWTLPFFINPGWIPGVNLLVTVLDYDPDFPEYENEIEAYERDNSLVSRIRDEIWLVGWWKAVDLPYQAHPDGGLTVIHFQPLNEDVMFACYVANNFYKMEQFAPPVPIDGYERIYGEPPSSIRQEVDQDGFFSYGVLNADFFLLGEDNQYYPMYGKAVHG
ncbi:hypothetical protein [uncultured Nostoc sp.]|uniref:hypothetical protein n=1 Tax=uncultured Nostoc sp. TaxID=340711 RepID=UPI0035C97ABD